MLPFSYRNPRRCIPLISESPSKGAFLRSSVHLLQIGLGSSPGRGNNFAIAPSYVPLRSTKRNQPTGLPFSSVFCQRPATVGSAARAGFTAIVKTAKIAMISLVKCAINRGIPVRSDDSQTRKRPIASKCDHFTERNGTPANDRNRSARI